MSFLFRHLCKVIAIDLVTRAEDLFMDSSILLVEQNVRVMAFLVSYNVDKDCNVDKECKTDKFAAF